jgi:methylthioribose-1-phosphate isomerase
VRAIAAGVEETIRAIRWEGGALRLLDQRKLPLEEIWVDCRTAEEVAAAIREMVVRGAPAIGVTAAYGVVLAMARFQGDRKAADAELARVIALLAATRPTAVNLIWALERMRGVAGRQPEIAPAKLAQSLETAAVRIHDEDVEMCRAIGRHGAELIPDGAGILTHCNTGALATGGYGTALGVVRAARETGKRIHVYADETRPFLQGSRLTAWECVKEGIPATLICDGAAPSIMKRGKIQVAIVGADRVAANGDVANKIGTYAVALAAKAHGIPFFVAAPTSTIDLSTPNGDAIPIEQRDRREVTHVGGKAMAPEGIEVENPSFDVTPAELIAAIVTEKGIARPPYAVSLAALVGHAVSS